MERRRRMTFETGKEKFIHEEEELLKYVPDDKKEQAKQQYDMVFEELIKKCNKNEEFNKLVLQEHKSWKRCYKFMEKKARDIACGSSACAVHSDTLFSWIAEYYNLDDKEEIEKERKIELERAAKRKEQSDKAKKEPKKEEPKKAEPKVEKKGENHFKKKTKSTDDNIDGQMNLLQMFCG